MLVSITLSLVCGVICLLLLAYWLYLVVISLCIFKLIMTVERKLAQLSSPVGKVESGKKTQSSSSCSSQSSRGMIAEGQKEKVQLTIVGKWPKVQRTKPQLNFSDVVEMLATFVKDYMNSTKYSVTADVLPGFLSTHLSTHAPLKGVSFSKTMDDLQRLVVSGMTHFKHPHYLASNLLTRSVPDIIGEVIAVHIGSPGFIYDASPAIAEMQVAMLNWAGRALGIPEKFIFGNSGNSETSQGGASFQESIGDSTLCTLMVARTYVTNQQYIGGGIINKDEHYLFAPTTAENFEEHHWIYSRLCVYASSEAHSTVEKQCRIAMLRLRKIAALPKNGYGVKAKQVEKTIKDDIARGRIPACIIATLGTEGVLANDELGQLGRLGIKYGCWVHVMAHNVSSFWIEPKFRPSTEELQLAHSIMGVLPYHSPNMVVVWTKKQSVWKDGFKIFAQYLKPSKLCAIDERDWTIHLNRRFRGIKIWLNYRMIGLKRMREHTNYICQLTAYLEDKMTSHPNVRLFGPRVLNTLCFQYHESGLSPSLVAKYTSLLGIYINESHRLFLNCLTVSGSVILSISITFEETTYQILDQVYADLDELIRKFRDHKNNPALLKFPPEPSEPFSEISISLTALHTARTLT